MEVDPFRAAYLRWKDSPETFAREVFGLHLWSGQAAFLRAVAEHPRVALRSGHKIGKSTAIAVLALWWVLTRPEARVILTSAGDRQVRKILWKEIRRLHARAAARGTPIGGILHDDPGTGLIFPDGRDVIGFATKDAESMAGYSGANLLFLVDEASGVPEPIFEAIEGNRAGGGRLAICGNPTQTSGTFFDAFGRRREFWKVLHVSSEETPNVREGRVVIPGLATREWVAERKAEWGEESPLYQVRVRGNFPEQGARSVVPIALVSAATDRWDELPDPASRDVLNIGVDVARFGEDESVVVVRRGNWVGRPVVFTKLDGPSLAGEVLSLARTWKRRGERPVVRVDVIGVGASVYDVLARSDEVETVGVNVAQRSTAPGYALVRDQAWGSLRDWLAEGAIPDDPRLHAEVLAPEYGFDARGRQKVESKDEIRRRLGRSPDRADALCLAVFDRGVFEEQDTGGDLLASWGDE